MAGFVNPVSGAILWDNFLADTGVSVISSPSNLSTLTPKKNLLVQNRASVVLLTSNAGGSFVFDLGYARRPRAVAFVDNNAVISGVSSANQWSLVGADDSGMSANVVSWQFSLYSNDVTRFYIGPDTLAGYSTFSTGNDIGVGINTDSVGRIIIGSRVSGFFREIRFLSDGELDTSFGSGNGYVDTAMTGTTELMYYEFKDSAGRRVAVGSSVVDDTVVSDAGLNLMFGGTGVEIDGGSDLYMGATVDPTREAVWIPLPSVSITQFYVASSLAPGTGETYVFTVYKNADATAMAATISSAGTSSSYVGAIAFAAGDKFSVRIVSSAGASTGFVTYSASAGETAASAGTKGLIGVFSNDGTLDTAFHVDGQNTFTVSADAFVYAKHGVQQTTGHYVVTGSHGSSSSSSYFFFYRCTSTGGTETNLADLSFSLTPFTATGGAVDSNDKPLIIGTSGGLFTSAKMAIARALSNITALDTTFSGDGKYEHQFNLSVLNITIGEALAIQSDGKIVAVGSTLVDNVTDGSISLAWGVIRLTSAGVLDTSFATNGEFVYNWGTGGQAKCVVILSDGSILIGGSGVLNGVPCIALIKLKSSGLIDTSFGDNGVATLSAGAANAYIEAIHILSTGKILCTGVFESYLDVSNSVFVARFNSDGSLDSTFAADGPNAGRRYWQLNIGTTNSSPAHGKVGYFFLGDYVDIRPEPGATVTYSDESNVFETRAGVEYCDIMPISRDCDFAIEDATKAELTALRTMAKSVGNHRPIILDLMANSGNNEDVQTGTIYGHLDKSGYFSIDLRAAQTDNIKIKVKESTE